MIPPNGRLLNLVDERVKMSQGTAVNLKSAISVVQPIPIKTPGHQPIVCRKESFTDNASDWYG